MLEDITFGPLWLLLVLVPAAALWLTAALKTPRVVTSDPAAAPDAVSRIGPRDDAASRMGGCRPTPDAPGAPTGGHPFMTADPTSSDSSSRGSREAGLSFW